MLLPMALVAEWLRLLMHENRCAVEGGEEAASAAESHCIHPHGLGATHEAHTVGRVIGAFRPV
jgi:hypothetical protein